MIRKIAQLPQQQQILVAVLAAGALFAVWYYVVQPMGGRVEELEADIKELTVKVEKGQEIEAQLPQFQQEVQELEQRLAQRKQALPDQKETAEIVRRVEELAVESNLDIRSFTPQATVNKDFYEDWPIRISLEGNYNNLGLFFQKVAQFERIINVDDIQIRALTNTTSRDRTISATCTATTFVFLEEEEEEAG
ncbi:type 4a pilus biogenesis protein PilO [Acidobacteria bacterium AH-259-O06]|nr:type 4a pilus biogenesis protein PilO [Acidobacteria bacterium AH-259-O06]